MRSTLLLSAVLALGLLGCSSYKLGTYHDPGFKTIFVENLRSEVDEPGLENLVSTTIVRQIQKDGTVQVTNLEDADVILRGHINEFEMTPVRYSHSNEITPTEANMTIGITYTLTRKKAKESFYRGHATGTTSLFIGSDLQSDKRQGVPLAAEDLGRKVVSQFVDAW